MSSAKTPFITLVLFFILLYIYTTLAGPIPFSVNSVQTNKNDLFRVEGVGKATAVPDTAQISLGITKTAATVKDAQSAVNTTINKLTSDLKNIGVEDKNIKTTNYSVSPNYEFTSGKQTTSGYTITTNIEAKIKPIEKANQAVDIATAAGANLIGGITFTLDDDTKKKLEEDARKEAIKNAKEKAESLANAAGIKLGRIVDVQEYGNEPLPRFDAMPLTAEKSSDQTQLSPGENTIQVTISLSYETR